MKRLLVSAITLGWLTAIGAATNPPQWHLPPGIPAPRVPDDGPLTQARAELGRHLFYDTRLSGNGTQSCSSCHRQELAFTDGTARPNGSTGEAHPRNSMTLVNVAYRDALTWANPTLRTLETQVLVPLFGEAPVELGLTGIEADAYARLAEDARYTRLFAEAFPEVGDPITTDNIVRALAAFQRSIVSFRSPFDRDFYWGETDALSEPARRGSVLFFSNQKARCSTCHQGLNLDGGSTTVRSRDEAPVSTFHNTGLFNRPGFYSYPDDNTGLYEITGQTNDMGRFRVPTLRNIAVTAPYMHDGGMRTLDEVLDHYMAGGRTDNPNKSALLRPLTLTADERADLIAFLRSLTDEAVLRDSRWSDPWRAYAANGE